MLPSLVCHLVKMCPQIHTSDESGTKADERCTRHQEAGHTNRSVVITGGEGSLMPTDDTTAMITNNATTDPHSGQNEKRSRFAY